MIELGHQLHGWTNVLEEFLVSRAEVVEPPFAIGSPRESVLWALTIASEADIALATIFRQCVALRVAEGFRLRTIS